MPLDLTTIPHRVKRIRGDASQAEFAAECGLTQGQISAYELGKAFPTLESTARMCKARGISIAAFLEEIEPSCAPPRTPSKEEMAIWVVRALGIDGFKLDHVRRILMDGPGKY